MNEYIPEVVHFNISFIVVLLIAFIAAGLAYTLYHQTNPDESSAIKFILGLLRSLTIIAIIILFFKPKVFYRFIENKPQKVALLIDNSASMAFTSQEENRRERTEKTLEEVERKLTEYEADIYKLSFNHAIQTDTVTHPFGPTNFENTFKQLAEKDLNKIILISDGIRTEDGLPNMSQGIPVFAIGIGSLEQAPDVFITDVDFNPVVYQGKKQKIHVNISAANNVSQEARVTLSGGNGVLVSSKIILEDNRAQQEVVFEYETPNSGLLNYTVEILPEGSDSNLKNNRFSFSQEVLKSKIRIGIFSSMPNNEHKFLKFILSKNVDFEVYSYLQVLNKELSNSYPVDSLDVIILQGYPGAGTPLSSLDRVIYSLDSRGQGLIVMLDKQTDISILNRVKKNIPFAFLEYKKNPSEFQALLAVTNSSLIRLYDSEQVNSGFFNSVPPLTSYFNIKYQEQAGIENFLQSSGKNGKDLIMSSSEKDNKKSIIINGSGLWRWHFVLQDDIKYKDGYEKLITNMIRWVTNKNKFKPVVLDINIKSVSPGQPIKLDGFLFDAQNKPIKDGRINVEATWMGQPFTIAMNQDSSGRFSVNYTPFNEGQYVVIATGYDRAGPIGTDRKVFDVIPYNREFIHTTQDSSFLRFLARQSGGGYYTPASLDSLFTDMDLSPLKTLKSDETDLRFMYGLLFLIIALITIEWSIRKTRNLV